MAKKSKSIRFGVAALTLGTIGLMGNGCYGVAKSEPVTDASTSDGSRGATDANPDSYVAPPQCVSECGACFDSSLFFALDPTKVRAPVLGQSVCQPAEIAAFIPDCFHITPDAGPPTDGPTACDADMLANGACAKCLLGRALFSDGGSEEGPEYPAALQISADGNVVPNTFGCIAALSTGSATCKANFNALAECAISTCSNCADADFSVCVDTELSDTAATCLQQFPDVDSHCLAAVNTASSSSDATTKCASGVTDFATALTTVATSLCGAP